MSAREFTCSGDPGGPSSPEPCANAQLLPLLHLRVVRVEGGPFCTALGFELVELCEEIFVPTGVPRRAPRRNRLGPSTRFEARRAPSSHDASRVRGRAAVEQARYFRAATVPLLGRRVCWVWRRRRRRRLRFQRPRYVREEEYLVSCPLDARRHARRRLAVEGHVLRASSFRVSLSTRVEEPLPHTGRRGGPIPHGSFGVAYLCVVVGALHGGEHHHNQRDDQDADVEHQPYH